MGAATCIHFVYIVDVYVGLGKQTIFTNNSLHSTCKQNIAVPQIQLHIHKYQGTCKDWDLIC